MYCYGLSPMYMVAKNPCPMAMIGAYDILNKSLSAVGKKLMADITWAVTLLLRWRVQRFGESMKTTLP